MNKQQFNELVEEIKNADPNPVVLHYETLETTRIYEYEFIDEDDDDVEIRMTYQVTSSAHYPDLEQITKEVYCRAVLVQTSYYSRKPYENMTHHVLLVNNSCMIDEYITDEEELVDNCSPEDDRIPF